MNVGHFFRHPLLLKIQSKKIPRNQCRSKRQFSCQKVNMKNSSKSMWVKNLIFMSERQYKKIREINVGQKIQFSYQKVNMKNSAKSM